MKKIFFVLISMISLFRSAAQPADKPTIEVLGFGKITVVPDYYRAVIFIQEEEKKVNYQTIGKVPLDSVKKNLFLNLKKYNIEEQDLRVARLSSRELGMFPGSLSNIVYICQLKNRAQGEKLVSEMRFEGLKGVVVQGQYSNTLQTAQDSLYWNAVMDAKRTATSLAQKSNKTLDEIKSITIINSQMPSNGEEYFDYNLSKFEIEFKDKYGICTVRVVYFLK